MLLTWESVTFFFLSIAGDTPPESCIFSQVLNITAFLVIAVAVLRYAQLKAKVKKPWLNIFGLIAPSLSSFGMTLVANFQLSNDRIIHNMGAVITIACGTASCWIHAVLTFQGNINNEGRKLGIFRVILSVIITLGFITYFFLLAQQTYLPGARVQWTSITCLLLYVVTFAMDFRHYDFEVHGTEKQANPTGNVSNIISEYRSEHL
ncbi:transmembrane protein 150C [Pristis pectinata]|uniref:transmembrane protein 150C n=1 Tax=Pristis pectinata TaxID=685728 RepID=UPI00223E85A4|nr:transmembrane protein 150C [Pristis pectinata]